MLDENCTGYCTTTEWNIFQLHSPLTFWFQNFLSSPSICMWRLWVKNLMSYHLMSKFREKNRQSDSFFTKELQHIQWHGPNKLVGLGCFMIHVLCFFIIIVTWKYELPNFWNCSGKPRLEPLIRYFAELWKTQCRTPYKLVCRILKYSL